MSVRLLAAGACYQGDVFGRCALQPSECNTSQIYRSSRWMTINDSSNAVLCANQASIHSIPAMGRCDSEAERFICTSHKSACFLDVSFKDLDPDCTVLDDFRPVGTPFTRSYFGECVTTEQGRAQNLQDYCAWQFSECPKGGTYVFETADEFFAAAMPSCQCDQVRTGACVSTTNSADFFCAVSEHVCGTEAGFQYLKAFEVQDSLGMTCMLCDSLPPGPQTRYTQAGSCIISSTSVFKRCALLPEHCDGLGERFVSSRQLRRNPSLFPTMAQGCLVEQGLHQVRVGRCAAEADQHICTSDQTACKISQSFQANDEGCRLVQDFTPKTGELSTTHFGYCTGNEDTTFSGYQADRESYCAWRFDECKSSDPNARPLMFGDANPGMAASLPTCQCDDVRVGGCVNPNDTTDLYCALGQSACDAGLEYHNVRSLEQPSGLNTLCFLCQSLPPPSPTVSPPSPSVPRPSPSVPSSPQNPSPTAPSQAPPPSKGPQAAAPTLEEFENDPMAVGAIVGIILGVVLTLCVVAVAVCSFGLIQKRQGMTDDNEKTASVPEYDSSSQQDPQGSASTMEQGQTEEDFVSRENNLLT